ncbi:MAG: thioredoxin family protein [Phycisphaerales bacterium JB065]
MFPTDTLRAAFQQGVSYEQFVDSGAPEGHDAQWHTRYSQLELTPDQRHLIEGFTREMKVLCITGTWCGDCALQGAAMQRIAEANPLIELRFLNRNDQPHLQMALPINAGYRVPVTFFMAEDFEPVARFGDRTLSRYRSMARKALPNDGAGVVLTDPPDNPVRTVLQEVLNEFERTQLLLRLSPRLRELHND